MSLRIGVSVVTELAKMDPKDRYVVESIALSTAAEDVGEGIQSPENDTNSLQSLSYLDPPVDSVYMICGVLIAMVLVGVIIILLAVTISKLRKREEHHHRHSSGNAVHPEQVQCATVGTPSACRRQQQQQHHHQQQQREGIVNPAMSNSTTTVDSCCAGATTHSAGSTLVAALGNGCAAANQLERTSPDTASTMVYTTGNASAEQFIWQFPPPYPSPNTPPPQYTLYNDQDTLVHGLQSDRQGFAKGFRKNLGGRWRRLVKRKPESEQCAIPPELKDQLKTIYVY